mmetsp:Transcript_32411/g.75496  ORF Transcript_32411/g.75496 Transcript_32411/m.75496 type:complete len:1076 (-) Transcript_32411:1022-4249(-)
MVNFGRLDLLALSAQRHTLLAARHLDSYREDPPLLHHTKTLAYAFFSSQPVERVFRLRWVRLSGVLLILPYLIFQIVTVVNSSREYSMVPSFKYYRWTNLEHRDGGVGGGMEPRVPGIQEFGLARLGERRAGRHAVSSQGDLLPCKARDPVAATSVDGASMTIEMDTLSPEPYHMLYIKTLLEPGTEGTDSVRFRFEGTNDLNSPWTTVGSSSFVWYYQTVYYTHSYAETPLERGGVLVLDASMPWPYRLYLSISMLFYGMWLITLALACFGHRVKSTIVLNMTVQFVLRIAFGIIKIKWAWQDDAYHVHAFVMGTTLLVAAIWIEYLEELSDVLCIFVGIVQIGMSAYMHTKLLGEPLVFTVENGSTLQAMGFMFLGLMVMTSRLRGWQLAVREMEKGKRVYEEVWERVVEGQREDLERLREAVVGVQDEARGRKALQLTRITAVPMLNRTGNKHPPSPQGRREQGRRGFLHTMRGIVSSRSRVQPSPADAQAAHQTQSFTIDICTSDQVYGEGAWGYLANNVMQSEKLHNSMLRYSHQNQEDGSNATHHRVKMTPVQTLDQAHAQAFLVHDMFVQMVVRLARLHQGKFRLSAGEGTFGQWHGGPVSRNRFVLGGLKSVASCVRKLDVAYSRDVSRLVDLCRETIYFDSVANITACLRAIAADEIIEIVRVKSTMDPIGVRESEEGALFAGMRFVKVNLKLVGSEEARSLCVDQHVVELLLVLTDIGRVQTEEMRSAYREWRKCKRMFANLRDAWRWARVVDPSGPTRRSVQKLPQRNSLSGTAASNDASQADPGELRTLHQASDGAVQAAVGWHPGGESPSLLSLSGPFLQHRASIEFQKDEVVRQSPGSRSGGSDGAGVGAWSPLDMAVDRAEESEGLHVEQQQQQQKYKLEIELPIVPFSSAGQQVDLSPDTPTLPQSYQEQQPQPTISVHLAPPSPKLRPRRLPSGAAKPQTPLFSSQSPQMWQPASSVPLAPPNPALRPLAAPTDATPPTPLEFATDLNSPLHHQQVASSNKNLSSSPKLRSTLPFAPEERDASSPSLGPNEQNGRRKSRRGSLFPSVKSQVSEMQVME